MGALDGTPASDNEIAKPEINKKEDNRQDTKRAEPRPEVPECRRSERQR